MILRARKIKRSDYQVKNKSDGSSHTCVPLNWRKTPDLREHDIMHHRTFEERGMQYPRVVIDNHIYNIHHCEGRLLLH